MLLIFRDQPEDRQDILTALMRSSMFQAMFLSFFNFTYTTLLYIMLTLFPDFVKQMFNLRPNLTCSMFKSFDILYSMWDFCFVSIQGFRAFSILKPYEYHALNHDRNSCIIYLLKNNELVI